MMKTIRDKYTEETGYMDFEYSDGWETYYTSRYGSWLESRLEDLQPVTEIETSIRDMAQMIHVAGLDHEFVTTMLDMFKSIAGLQATVKGKLDK